MSKGKVLGIGGLFIRSADPTFFIKRLIGILIPEIQGQPALTALLALLVQALINSDSIQPCSRIRVASKSIVGLIGFYKNILGDIFRFLLLPHKAKTNLVYPSVVSLE